VQHTEVLDALAALYEACDHPEAEKVSRYGRDSKPGGQSPPGVKLTYRSSGSSALLYAAVEPRPAPDPVALPEKMPPPSKRATRMLAFTVQLLDYARPPIFKSWEACGYPGVWLSPSALRIECADDTTVYLRIAVASGTGREPEIDPHPNYHFPEGIRKWPPVVSAPSAAQG
jgi:hypothetical protein